MNRYLAVLAVTIALAVCLATAGHSQTSYPLSQYLSARMAIAPTCSPDGKEVAFLTDITGALQVWKISSSGGWPYQLTFFPSGVAVGPQWSPAGDEILVSADTDGNQQYQIYLVRPDGCRLTPLTSNPKVRYMLGGWSRDGGHIFYSSNARDERYYDCYVMDIATRKERRVFQKDAVLSAKALSADGRFLAATDVHSEVNADVYIAAVATDKASLITSHRGDAKYDIIGFAADGRHLYVASDQGREFLNLAWIDTTTGKLSFLRDDQADMDNGILSPDRRRLAFTLNHDGYEDLTLWNTLSRRTEKGPTLPRGIATVGGFSADGNRLVITFNGSTIIDDLWMIDVRHASTNQITFSSSGGVDKASLVEPSLLRYRSFDGRMIPAFLYLPRNAPKNRSVPVILSVHGGPEDQEQPYYYAYYQYFVSRGYAVLTPNTRGSNGYGKGYLALDNGPKRWDALKDLAAAEDWIATQPALSPRKVAIFGASYGGFSVLAMLAHYPDRFAAGIDFYGPADLKTFLTNTAPYRRPNRIAEYGDPVRDSAFMDAISPLRHASSIKAPLLVIQGANDPIVPPSESKQIVETISGNGGIARFMLLPDEGHGLSKLSNRLKVFEAMIAFLDEYVKNKR